MLGVMSGVCDDYLYSCGREIATVTSSCDSIIFFPFSVLTSTKIVNGIVIFKD